MIVDLNTIPTSKLRKIIEIKEKLDESRLIYTGTIRFDLYTWPTKYVLGTRADLYAEIKLINPKIKQGTEVKCYVEKLHNGDKYYSWFDMYWNHLSNELEFKNNVIDLVEIPEQECEFI